jgi:hypothetical protein
MRKLFKTVDEKLRDIGFCIVDECKNRVCYERKNEVFDYTQVLYIGHNSKGRHFVQSFDKDLVDDKGVGNTCVGLTYYEMKLVMKKMRQRGWKTNLPLLYKRDVTTNIDKVKAAYHKYDICMSELLRDQEFSSLSREEKIELLEWAGEEEYVTVTMDGEIEYKSSDSSL